MAIFIFDKRSFQLFHKIKFELVHSLLHLRTKVSHFWIRFDLVVIIHDLLEHIVVYLSQFEFKDLQSILNSSQIIDKVFAYLFNYPNVICLVHYLRALQYHVRCFFNVVQIFIDLIASITLQCLDAILEDFHVFS